MASAARELFELVGRLLDQREAQDMAPQQDVCGLEHDLSVGRVRLKPRESLLTKIFFLLWSTLSRDLLPPALCSKMFGIMGSIFTGTHVKLGRCGQHATRQRMYSDVKSYRLSHRLRRALIFFTKVFTIMTARPVRQPPIIVASDGQLGSSKEPNTRNSGNAVPRLEGRLVRAAQRRALGYTGDES